MLLVKCSENLMDFDTRNVKTRTMERWVVFWMQARTTSTTNWHVMFSLNPKLDTGMILLKNKVKSVLRFLKHFPLPVMKMLIFNTRSMGHMTRVKWQITHALSDCFWWSKLWILLPVYVTIALCRYVSKVKAIAIVDSIWGPDRVNHFLTTLNFNYFKPFV